MIVTFPIRRSSLWSVSRRDFRVQSLSYAAYFLGTFVESHNQTCQDNSFLTLHTECIGVLWRWVDWNHRRCRAVERVAARHILEKANLRKKNTRESTKQPYSCRSGPPRDLDPRLFDGPTDRQPVVGTGKMIETREMIQRGHDAVGDHIVMA